MDNEYNDAMIKDMNDNDLNLEADCLSQEKYQINFDPAFIIDDPDIFVCSICQMVMFLPVVLPDCSHHFCRGCLQGWLIEGNNCPLCRKPFVNIKGK